MDSGVYDYHYWLGCSLEQGGDKLGARQQYLQALDLNEDSAETRLRLAALEGK
jgi:Flp pilus assembly protein TadD